MAGQAAGISGGVAAGIKTGARGDMTEGNKKQAQPGQPGFEQPRDKVKFEIYGDEMIEKTVNSSGNSGRVYLPPEWIGRTVKVVKC